jgi:SAM-dependent methyltransferase
VDYYGDFASAQQQLSRSLDLTARRVAVLEALDLRPGETVVEIGCGGGVYLREIALAVRSLGSVTGFDLSSDQVAAARDHCADLENVRVEVGDLLALPVDESTVDAVVAVQVLEYVTDINAALAEIHRVLRGGGRLVNVATNWGSLFWSGGDPRLTAKVLRAWDQHAPHPNLPVELPVLLHRHGFVAVAQRPVTIMNRHFHPATFAWGAAQLMAAFALSIGALTDSERVDWLTSLRNAEAEGVHFLSSVPVLTVATSQP